MSIGKKGISVIERMYDGNSNPDAFDFVAGFTAMYNDGKNGKPFGTSLRESNVLNDNQLKLAYNAGEIDRIKETRGGKDKPSINRDKTKTIKRAKKSDWASTDTIWYAPNEKTGKDTIIAYSTTATSDFISALAADNVNSTISEIKDMVNYDVEAKRVLQAYIDSGFGNVLASDFFGKFVNKTKTLQESTTEGRIEAETYINKNTESVEDVNNGKENDTIRTGNGETISQAQKNEGGNRTFGRGLEDSGTVQTSNEKSKGTPTTKEVGEYTYSYSKIELSEASENARNIVKELKKYGLQADIYDGTYVKSGYGKSIEKTSAASSISADFVLVNNNTEAVPSDISPHEAFHSYIKAENVFAKNFYATICFEFKEENEFSKALMAVIAKEYNREKSEMLDELDDKAEEVAAYICGWLSADYSPEEIFSIKNIAQCFDDFEAVKSAHTEFINAITVKEKTKDVYEGIERLCSLHRAHSKSIVAARLRIDKSKEELKQLSDYAERYRKDVNAV